MDNKLELVKMKHLIDHDGPISPAELIT